MPNKMLLFITIHYYLRTIMRVQIYNNKMKVPNFGIIFNWLQFVTVSFMII